MKSKEKYIPPYKVSEEAVNLIAEISAAVERFDIEISGVKGVRLRKTNRIKTIHGSTAIEGNTLTEDQVTAVLAGKKVVAPQREIDEVLCAAAAYEAIERGVNKKCKVRIAAHTAILKFDRRVALRSAMPAAFLCRQCIPASLHRAATSVLQADSIMPDPM